MGSHRGAQDRTTQKRKCNKTFIKKPLSSIPPRFRSCVQTQKARVAISRPFTPIRPNHAERRPVLEIPKRTVTGATAPVKETQPRPAIKSPESPELTSVNNPLRPKPTNVVDLRTSSPGVLTFGLEL